MPQKNIHSSVGRTGGKRRNHHCNECKKAFADRCVNKGHQVLCEVENCKHLLAPKHGCTKHRYRDGYNNAIHDIYKHRDPDVMSQKRAAADEQLRRERHEKNSHGLTAYVRRGTDAKANEEEAAPDCQTPARTENDDDIDEI